MKTWPKMAVLLACLCTGLTLAGPVAAAPPSQSGEVYVVQAGDTLLSVASYFGMSVEDVLVANDLDDPDFIYEGQQLLVPALEVEEPAVPAPTVEAETTELSAPTMYVVQPGDTLFAIAYQYGMVVEDVMLANGITDADFLSVGQILTIPGDDPVVTYPEPFAAVRLWPNPVVQGQTLVVKVNLNQPAVLSGEFDGRPVFFSADDTEAWGLVGIHPLQAPGPYSLTLLARQEDGILSTVTVDAWVGEGVFGTENIQLPEGSEYLLDPTVVGEEYARLDAAWHQLTPTSLWDMPFVWPVDSQQVTSVFGTRRSYNGGPVDGFHTGVDLRAGEGLPILAPAPGQIVLAEDLTVRGGAILIDHGMGVYSGYWHQSQVMVEPGQLVQAGELIGLVGNTGRSTGAHLHWEMRIGGIPVDPEQWVQFSIP